LSAGEACQITILLEGKTLTAGEIAIPFIPNISRATGRNIFLS
jgi:hypothetical protein